MGLELPERLFEFRGGVLGAEEPDLASVIAELRALADQLQVNFDTIADQAYAPARQASAWTAPTFNTNWGNYGGAWQTVQYRRDELGMVHLRGLALRSTSGFAYDTNTGRIFTLPSGYRPALNEMFLAHCVDQSTGNVNVQRIDVTSAGLVYVAGPAVSTGPAIGSATTYVSLSGIRFQAA